MQYILLSRPFDKYLSNDFLDQTPCVHQKIMYHTDGGWKYNEEILNFFYIWKLKYACDNLDVYMNIKGWRVIW